MRSLILAALLAPTFAAADAPMACSGWRVTLMGLVSFQVEARKALQALAPVKSDPAGAEAIARLAALLVDIEKTRTDHEALRASLCR